MDTKNSVTDGPELAEPYLRQVLGMAGLAVEYVRAEGNTLYRRGEGGEEIAVADFAGGYGSVLLGHNHPDLVACAQELLAAGTPVHAQFSRHPYANRLAAELNRIVGRELGTDEPYFAIFANSGAEAVEAALKHAELDRGLRIAALRSAAEGAAEAARDAVAQGRAQVPGRVRRRFGIDAGAPSADALEQLTARLAAENAAHLDRPPLFLALEGGFHGKLGLSVQLTHNESYRIPFRALGAQARFVPPDRPEALKEIHARERGVLHVLEVSGDQVDVVEREFPVFCAFLVEPIQGEGGIRVLDAEFAGAIQRFCAEIDCPVVVDEIQSGMGRTGRLLASSRAGLRGDYYTLAKTLGGGLAKTSVMLVRRARYRQEFEIVHSSTFAKDSFSCTIALKVLELLEADGGAAYRRAEERGAALRTALEAVRDDFPDLVGDVRGQGLMLGLEFRDQGGSASESVRALAGGGLFGYFLAGHLLHAHRVRTFPTASAVNTLRFEPSVHVSDEEIGRLEAGLRDVCRLLREGAGDRLAGASAG
ncbi:aminotransferase class III-fold pyridoxal phosphate-dependent enzyme [Streptomyces sp. SID10815]|uniref:aspartate aminotransferase family protein n=1 Tax=Streptomyces sp. SID10815 TaxID=2706027 RepID=UPI0013CA653B|nr:aminotransferase class III-fold pyridoxal phosphate-dependent enzyme [Streptomyces sp. SID10815]NEA48820.1 aminotransferase class III-fold pyridoxal phosphate-dependent enzyme [Streptomyces sp. SID10815]